MKSTKDKMVAILTALGMALLATGCADSDDGVGDLDDTTPVVTNAVVVPSPTAPVTGLGRSTADEASRVADAAKREVDAAAHSVGNAVDEVGTVAQAKFNEVVAQIRQLIEAGKGTEAIQQIQSALTNWRLTPEQQQTINNLRQEAQTLLSRSGLDGATQAVGSLLNPRPQD